MSMAPPKILNVVREVVKPGKGGAAHERTESAFVRAMTAAKATDHYFALDSLSGPQNVESLLSLRLSPITSIIPGGTSPGAAPASALRSRRLAPSPLTKK